MGYELVVGNRMTQTGVDRITNFLAGRGETFESHGFVRRVLSEPETEHVVGQVCLLNPDYAPLDEIGTGRWQLFNDLMSEMKNAADKARQRYYVSVPKEVRDEMAWGASVFIFKVDTPTPPPIFSMMEAVCDALGDYIDANGDKANVEWVTYLEDPPCIAVHYHITKPDLAEVFEWHDIKIPVKFLQGSKAVAA
jgi:hypothetical protein